MAISVPFFPNFTIFGRIVSHDYYSAHVGNQLKVKPNAMVIDDALMQQCATACSLCVGDGSQTGS